MNYKKMIVRTGKANNDAVASTPKIPIDLQNPVAEVLTRADQPVTIASDSTSATSTIPYYNAFYNGLDHSSDFRYIVASTLIGYGGSLFIGLIGFPITGFLASMFTMFTMFSSTFIVICKMDNIFDKSSNKLDFSNSQISYFGSISSIIDYECGVILFGKGSCYGDALDKSFEYFISTQSVKNGLDHAAEIKYAMIIPLAMTKFLYPFVSKTPSESIKTMFSFYVTNILSFTIGLENYITGMEPSAKFIGAIPSIVDHHCDLILNKSTGCYGTVIDTLYQSTFQILGIEEEIFKKLLKERLEHKSDYKYVLMGLIPIVGIAYVKGQIIIPSFIASVVLGTGLIEFVDIQSEYSLPFNFGVFSPKELNGLKNLVEGIHKMIGTLPCMLDHMCGAILFGNGSCYGDIFDRSYEYTSEIYGSIKNSSDSFSAYWSNDYHDL